MGLNKPCLSLELELEREVDMSLGLVDVRFSVLELSDCKLHLRQSLFQLVSVTLLLVSIVRHSLYKRCCHQVTSEILWCSSS